MNAKPQAYVKWSIKFSITIGLFVLLFRPDLFGLSKKFINVEFSDVLEEIRGLRMASFIPWMLAAFLIKGSGMLASMRRWDLLLRGQGIIVPFKHLVGTFLIGRFFGTFLPSTIGLDFYKTYDIARHSKLISANVAVVFVEKIIGFFSLSLLLFVTAPFGTRFIPPQAVIGLLVLFAIPITVSFTVLLFPGAVIWFLNHSFMRIEILDRRLRSAVDAVSAYRNQRPLLMRAVGYGIIVHAATAFMYYATARAIAAQVHFGDIMFVSPIMIAATVGVPLSMGGEGIREGTFIYLLNRVGVVSSSAFILSHLGFWVGEIISLAGGVIYMLRPAGYRPKLAGHAIEALEREGHAVGESSGTTGRWSAKQGSPGAALYDALLLGLVSGIVFGLCESIVVLAGYSDIEWGVVWFAVATYGLAGVGVAAGSALILLFLGKWEKTFHECLPQISATVVFGLFALIVGRFRIRRDLFAEQVLGKLGLLLDLGLLTLVGLVVLLLGIAFASRWWSIGSNQGRRVAHGVLTLAVALAAVSFATTPGDPRERVSDSFAGTKPVLTVQDKPNILLIAIDALRADALGCYGAEGNPTPNIDAFAAESVQFDRTFAQCSWTRPSFATIFTSRYPSSHTAKYKFSRLPDEVVTLAESLQAAGYQTIGLANNTNLAPAFNYQQGFDRYDYLAPDPFFAASTSASRLVSYQILRKFQAAFGKAVPDINYFYRDAAYVNQAALQSLSELDAERPAFLFVHYMEPHDPYLPHPDDGSGVARARTPNPDPAEARRLRALYDGEVRYLDGYLGALLAAIRETPFARNLLIVITSDHGEEFQDHGGWWHGTTLYEEAIHVPLLIQLPDRARSGETIYDLARLLDLTPTLLARVGVPAAEEMQGKDLFAVDGAPTAYVFAEEDHEGNVIHALRGDRWKYIEANPKNPRKLEPKELYDLNLDPGERENKAHETDLNFVADRMGGELQKTKEAAASGAVVEVTTTLDREISERLNALGYL